MTLVTTLTFDVDMDSPDDFSNAARVTSPTYAGAGALRFNPTAAVAYWQKNIGSSPTVLVYRARVRYDTKPSSNQTVVLCGFVNGVAQMGLGFDATNNQFAIFDGGVLVNRGGPTITTSQWYTIDVRINVVANPWVVDARIDGVALTQTTGAFAASTFAHYDLGTIGESLTYTLLFDSVDISHTSGDYPITDVVATPTSYWPTQSKMRW